MCAFEKGIVYKRRSFCGVIIKIVIELFWVFMVLTVLNVDNVIK